MADVLGAFEQAVLLAVIRLRENAYGRGIIKEVRTRLKREVAAGAVYATLERLEQKGLLSSHLGTGTAIRAGRARRYYSVEAAGVHALNQSKATGDAIWHGLVWPLKGSA